MMAAGLAVVIFLILQDFYETLTRKYQITSALNTINLLQDDDTVVIDIREPHEYAKGFIERAKNITVAKIDDKLPELAPHRNHNIIVTCQSGTRTAAVCKKLEKNGFEQVYMLHGGMTAWEDAKLPIKVRKAKR